MTSKADVRIDGRTIDGRICAHRAYVRPILRLSVAEIDVDMPMPFVCGITVGASARYFDDRRHVGSADDVYSPASRDRGEISRHRTDAMQRQHPCEFLAVVRRVGLSEEWPSARSWCGTVRDIVGHSISLAMQNGLPRKSMWRKVRTTLSFCTGV